MFKDVIKYFKKANQWTPMIKSIYKFELIWNLFHIVLNAIRNNGLVSVEMGKQYTSKIDKFRHKNQNLKIKFIIKLFKKLSFGLFNNFSCVNSMMRLWLPSTLEM